MKIKHVGLFLANLAKPFHSVFISERRKKILVEHLLQQLPRGETLHGLDVGCGNGKLASFLQQSNPGLLIDGVDVLTFDNQLLKNAMKFDGKKLPFKDNSYDFVMLIDVLHHSHDPADLLRECARVANKFVLIKDHLCQSQWDKIRLSWMDWVGNRAYNVSLPFNFMPEPEWQALFNAIGVTSTMKKDGFNLYPWPFSVLFEDKLHFIAKISVHNKK